MENKKYIKNMSVEELKKIFNNIEYLQSKFYENLYEDNMNYQFDLGKIFFGENYNNYIDIRDYYSSFFIIIKDAVKFFENLQLYNKDYLNNEDAKKYTALYKQAKKHYNNINKCNYCSDNYYKHFELLENTCKSILEILEKELHSLENIEAQDVLEFFINDVFENNDFYDYYILDDDFTKLYEHFDYIKEYN
jgi:hypothetical protein